VGDSSSIDRRPREIRGRDEQEEIRTTKSIYKKTTIQILIHIARLIHRIVTRVTLKARSSVLMKGTFQLKNRKHSIRKEAVTKYSSEG
jgi:hypothetical protein